VHIVAPCRTSAFCNAWRFAVTVLELILCKIDMRLTSVLQLAQVIRARIPEAQSTSHRAAQGMKSTCTAAVRYQSVMQASSPSRRRRVRDARWATPASVTLVHLARLRLLKARNAHRSARHWSSISSQSSRHRTCNLLSVATRATAVTPISENELKSSCSSSVGKSTCASPHPPIL
jgi:hypothetical protein